MKALDLFCGAGGVTKGLQRAGFKVHGVDINPQPRYCGEQFTQSDALSPAFTYEWLRHFDFIWASPPCQHYCALKTMTNARKHPDLIAPVRAMLKRSRLPYVIENVFGAPLKDAVMLCGSMFNLQSHGFQLRRHRYFESNCEISTPGPCRHADKTLGVYGAKVRNIAQEKRHYAKPKETRGNPIGVVLPQSWGFEAMGIDWMKIDELSESIPPAYSEFIARQIKVSS
jgi:DNA (cytosine-5)-methyltransferase 1